MLTITTAAIPAQEFNVMLAGQNCQIRIYQKSTGMYCDLMVNNSTIIAGVICQNLNPIVRDSYLGFVGDLMFEDTQGSSNPTYDGLNTRYFLRYVEGAA